MKNLTNLMNQPGAGFTTQYAIGLPHEVKKKLDSIRGNEGLTSKSRIFDEITRISLALGREIEMEFEREEIEWYGGVWVSQARDSDLNTGAVVARITDYYQRAEQTDDPRIKAMKLSKVGNVALMAAGGIGVDIKRNAHHLRDFDYLGLSRTSYRGAATVTEDPLLARVSERLEDFAQITALIKSLCLQGDYQAVWDLINLRRRALSTAGES